jgi:hypothetical protein
MVMKNKQATERAIMLWETQPKDRVIHLYAEEAPHKGMVVFDFDGMVFTCIDLPTFEVREIHKNDIYRMSEMAKSYAELSDKDVLEVGGASYENAQRRLKQLAMNITERAGIYSGQRFFDMLDPKVTVPRLGVVYFRNESSGTYIVFDADKLPVLYVYQPMIPLTE